MKFHHEYRLLKDTPTHPKGWPLRWNGMCSKFMFMSQSTWKHDNGGPGIYFDTEGQSLTVDQVLERVGEWFEPIGKEVDFIPKFPSYDKVGEFATLTAETRLVDSVDECRAMNMLFEDKGFQKRLYEFYRKEYNKFHKL